MIGCCSLVLPTILGSVFWHETIAPVQWAGLALLLTALMMSMDRRETRKPRPGWKGYCALFFVVSGLSGLIFKAHQNSPGKMETAEFLLIASIVSSNAVGADGGSDRSRAGRAQTEAAACGAEICAYLRHMQLCIQLAERSADGSASKRCVFPVFNGSVILGSSLAGCFCFRERLTRRQVIGLVLGLFSLVLIGKVLG